jgi:DNA polymerase epsilon subunit 1|tara:strand:+ start:7278 stop:7601 length:324 start_codon:yes stop_codon:yes gene_type:complete
MGGQPAFSGNTGGRSKGNMYGEAGRGKGQGKARVNTGGGDWNNQKSRLQMAMEEDAHEATLGYANFSEGDERLGWLMNVAAVRPLFECSAFYVSRFDWYSRYTRPRL